MAESTDSGTKSINPLKALIPLGKSNYLRLPSADIATTTVSHPAPATIVLCAWMDASPRYIAKYLSGYATLYPTARLILVTNSTLDFAWHSDATENRRLTPVVQKLRENGQDSILLHTFSNGGALQACYIAALYRQLTGSLLPVRAVILDSAPGRASMKRSATVLLQGLPKAWYLRIPGTILGYIFLVLWFTIRPLTGRKDTFERLREELNDPQIVRRDAKRCYIYSETDAAVGSDDVEEHIRDAQRKGFSVTAWKVDGTQHVAHIKAGEEKYWSKVQDVWSTVEPAE